MLALTVEPDMSIRATHVDSKLLKNLLFILQHPFFLKT
jgi:hypothetical protein